MTESRTPTAIPLTCWSCSTAADGGLFCPACRRIQPLPRSADYFSMLGLGRRLCIDLADLEQRFHQMSWKLHPDNYVRATDYERTLSLERASQLNDAYRTLRDPISRVEYLLAQEGMRKEGQSKQQAPPELLEEVFELNESLDELRMARKKGGDGERMAALLNRLKDEEQNFESKLGEVDAELEGLFREWDKALDAGADAATRRKLLAQMNDLLNRRSYIRNLVTNVQKELAEA